MTSKQEQQEQKDFHPLKVIEAETNVTGYKSRKTHYLTIPARVTQQAGYFFKPTERVKLVVDMDGERLTVTKLGVNK
jgi:hypothetical protein